MIYELRTYQLVVGGLSEYLELSRTKLLPCTAEHGIKPVGFWYTNLGPLNQVVNLTAFSDLNERQARWAAYAKDPRRDEVLPRLRSVMVSQTSQILLPTDLSEMK